MVGLRVGVFSDTHVGRSVPKAVGELRRQAYRHSFQQAIEIFAKKGVDYVVHAGDIFERRSMGPEDSVFVKEQLQGLVDSIHKEHGKDVKIFCVRGNHDGTPENSALDYISHPLAKYLSVLGDRTLVGEEELYSDGRVAVTGLGYHPYISSRFEKAKNALRRALSSAEGLRIVIMHSFISGYHDLPPGIPQHSVLNITSLKDLDADVVICGHYHNRTEPTRLGQSGSILMSPGSTEAVDLSDEGPKGVSILEDGLISFIPIQPLQDVRSVFVGKGGEVRPIGWLREGALSTVENYASELEAKGMNGILRIVLRGLTDGDPFDLEASLEAELAKIKATKPLLLHVEVENRVESVAHPFAPPSLGGREEFVAGALEPLGGLVEEALKIMEDVDHTLEERRSQKTWLLANSDRRPFVKRWVEVLEKVDVI